MKFSVGQDVLVIGYDQSSPVRASFLYRAGEVIGITSADTFPYTVAFYDGGRYDSEIFDESELEAI